jgi:hypothetical protein
MKLKGIATFVLRDKETGEITRTFEAENHIQDSFLEALSSNGSLSTNQDLNQTLFISETNPGRQRRDWADDIPNCVVGSVIAGVDQVQISMYDSPGIHLGTFVMRFAAPAQDYTINIAGLCSHLQYGHLARGVDTVVWLSTPCVQTTTETLDLYYRVQLLYEANWDTFKTNPFNLNPYETELVASFMFALSGVYPMPTTFSPYGFPYTKSNGRMMADPNSAFLTYDGFAFGGTGVTHQMDADSYKYFCRRNTMSRDIQTGVGYQVGHIGIPAGGQTALLQKLAPDGFSPVQSIFGHRDTSLTPFYNASESQFSLGTLSINGDAWTDPDFPKYVRLDVTTSGLVGVGEYQFRIRNSFGFLDNTWVNRAMPLHFSQGNNSHWYNDGFAWSVGDRDESHFTSAGGEFLDRSQMSYVEPISDTEVFVVNKNEFAVVNYLTGEGQAFTNETLVGLDVLPYFLATDISQVAVAANGDYYISCRNTGLYHLNAALDTLVTINSSTTGLTGVTGCKAVCIGNAGRLWAYWGHATAPDIYYSDDGGSSWTPAGFSETFVDANPDLVFNIQADPNDAVGKLALLHYDVDISPPTGTQNINLVWWDQNTTTSTVFGIVRQIIRTQLNYNNPPLAYGVNYALPKLVQCSPNDSAWACVNYRDGSFSSVGYPAWLTHGSVSVSALDGTTDLGTYMGVTDFMQDAAGNDAMLYLTEKGQTNNVGGNGSYTTLVSQNLTFETEDSTGAFANYFDGGPYPLCYLRDGVWMCSRAYAGDTISYNNRNVYFLYTAIPDVMDFDSLTALAAEFYPTYGWNGSAWEKGHAGSKTIHAAAEELIDGVTVAWDDATGTNQFFDTDHYTFGLFDGIWLDGSTQFDFRWDLYAKPSTYGTDVEASTLPAVTKVSNTFINELPDAFGADMQDGVSTNITDPGKVVATGTGLEGDYSAGCRSVNLAVDGTAQSYLPNQTYIPGTETNNCQGYIQFAIFHSAAYHLEAYWGMSPSDRLGTSLNHATIAHALHFDSVTPGNGVGTCTIRVVENGVERATVDGIPYDNAGGLQGRIALLTNGSVQYEYYSTAEGVWALLYTSTPGTVTIENMHFDCNYVPLSGAGIETLTYSYLDTSNPDYYLYLGDGIDKGVFNPTFRSIDPESVTVMIDGVKAVHIGINDNLTVLPANSYSIYPGGGVIRYSGDDTGKSVSAVYVTVHDE